MPTSSWLPRPGANFDMEDPSRRPRDFFHADLEVEVPVGWLVAGPGRREPVGDGRFRFRPAAPVPDIGFVASRFERRALHVADIELELLVSPGHIRNIAFFADAADALAVRVEELFVAAEDAGLGYPYEALSLVEVPAQLRTYGGGWRMDTVLSLPGVMLLRELGFPTSRFERQFRDPESLAEMASAEGGVGAAKVRALARFFENDVNGGNPFLRRVTQFPAVSDRRHGRRRDRPRLPLRDAGRTATHRTERILLRAPVPPHRGHGNHDGYGHDECLHRHR